MAQRKNTTSLTELLLQCVGQPDPMLSMLEWLCAQLMEAEVSEQVGAEKSERAKSRLGYRCGYRPRRLDTRMGNHVPYGTKSASGRLHSVLCNRTQTQRSSTYSSCSGGFCTGCFHS